MKAWHLLLIAGAVWFLFLRKRGPAMPVTLKPTSPHPATPLSPNQQIAVAAVAAAPAVFKAVGSFFSSSDDSSAASSDDMPGGDDDDEDA